MLPDQTPGDRDERPRRRLRRTGTTLGALLVAVALFTGGVVADRAGLIPVAGPSASDTGTNLSLVDQAWHLLQEHYVDSSTLDWRKIAYGAIGGMTQAVGDVGHTTFLTPSQLASEQAALSGAYVGIGAVIDVSGKRPVIVSVFPGSPAEAAGLGHGDVIVSIDGTDTTAMALQNVSSTIRGPEGSKVTLVIQPAGSSTNRTVTITRAKVDIPSVAWSMVPGTTVADIQITEFANGVTDALKKALSAATQAGATNLVLDLRSNPGGYVSEAVGVASQFLASGVVYVSENAGGTKTSVSVDRGQHPTDLPMVVLVNHSTASGAEIVAGALQDHHRAQVVGETTFGTGTVLNRFDLSDGSALWIGTEKWLTPSGHEIWHHGITPDHVVALAAGDQPVTPDQLKQMSAAEVASTKDAQLAAALKLLGGP